VLPRLQPSLLANARALAIETSVNTQLNTDSSEGPSSMPLRVVHQGDTNQTMRLFIFMCSFGSNKPEPDGALAVPPTFETSGSLQVRSSPARCRC
jgi:hypothetical protein